MKGLYYVHKLKSSIVMIRKITQVPQVAHQKISILPNAKRNFICRQQLIFIYFFFFWAQLQLFLVFYALFLIFLLMCFGSALFIGFADDD